MQAWWQIFDLVRRNASASCVNHTKVSRKHQSITIDHRITDPDNPHQIHPLHPTYTTKIQFIKQANTRARFCLQTSCKSSWSQNDYYPLRPINNISEGCKFCPQLNCITTAHTVQSSIVKYYRFSRILNPLDSFVGSRPLQLTLFCLWHLQYKKRDLLFCT